VYKLGLYGLDQGHLHPLQRASETDGSQSGIKPGTTCTAGEDSMQRAIRTAILTAIGNLGLNYYRVYFLSRFNMVPDTFGRV
jgi:hypothetical protein